MRSEAGPYWVKNILEATSGDLGQGSVDSFFDGICTDSREIKTNDLFIPLKGLNFDGTNFVIPALKAGAGGSLVNRDVHLEIPFNLSNTVLIKVQNTLRALTDLASTHRKIYPIPLIAITGSSGKTTVKEMIGAIIKRQASVKMTLGNFNNLIGLPMTILDIGNCHKYAVVEVGINQVGEMDMLARAASPTIAVITSIGHSHLEGLGSIENVATEKFKLVQSISERGLGVVPEENMFIKKYLKSFNRRIVTFGLSKGDFRADNIQLGTPTTFEVVGPFGRTRIEWNVCGFHNISNAVAAVATTVELGIDIEEIQKGLESFKTPSWRMEISNLAGSKKLIRDFYNANPLSMKAALQFLVTCKGNPKTLAILGDMMELGVYAPELHRELGEFAGKIGVKSVMYVGKFGEKFSQGFLSSRGNGQSINIFADKERAWQFLRQRIGEYDRILIKGSRSMKMEMIADQIEKEM
ncbi:MAG: UDP-N-acetylmuramoyl-tripeptide--D-alanyl-D-alanine ligase [Desulfomonilaceae bacterium]